MVLPVLLVAISAISAAAILVRLAPEVPPPAMAFWRCLGVGLMLAPSVRRTGRRDQLLIALASLALALHFWTWFESLRHTSVLRSTVLVCLTPAWSALLEWALMGRRPTLRYLAGVTVALGGIGLMATGASDARPPSLAGDGLAALGGLLAGIYMVTGRSVRQRVGIGTYGCLVSAGAAAWLLPVVLFVPMARHAPIQLVGWDTRTWLVLAALTAGPQLLGHVGLNFAVRYLPAAIVSLVVLLEPAGAAMLGGLVLHEWPSATEWAGAAVVLGGVALATAWRR